MALRFEEDIYFDFDIFDFLISEWKQHGTTKWPGIGTLHLQQDASSIIVVLSEVPMKGLKNIVCSLLNLALTVLYVENSTHTRAKMDFGGPSYFVTQSHFYRFLKADSMIKSSNHQRFSQIQLWNLRSAAW